MLPGAVPFVPAQAIARIARVHMKHKPVPESLGQDRSGRNTGIQSITADHRPLGRAGRKNLVAIHKNKIRTHGQDLFSSGHGPESRLKNVDPVDFSGPGKTQGPGQCLGLDNLCEMLAAGRGKNC